MIHISVTSTAFAQGGSIPPKYTCDGADVSPDLSWDVIPDGTKSIAILCDDPDAPVGDWVHWIVYNIPPDMNGVPENFSRRIREFLGVREGMNDFRRESFGGPCPPQGVHRYFFKVFFLNTLLDEKRGMTKAGLLAEVQGHVLGYGELVGIYQRT